MDQEPFIGTPEEQAAWADRLGLPHPDRTVPYAYAEGARVESVDAPLALAVAMVALAVAMVAGLVLVVLS
jgi:hypothetical protein